VTVVGPGTAIITVSTVVGNLTATCVVNGQNQAGPASAGAGFQKNDKPENPDGPPASKDNQQHLAKKDASATVSTDGVVSPEQAGSQPWRVFKMSPDAVPLQQKKKQNTLDIYAAVLFGALLFLGSGKRYVEYTREVVR
jgi:hypothetical protein